MVQTTQTLVSILLVFLLACLGCDYKLQDMHQLVLQGDCTANTPARPENHFLVVRLHRA
jgi:hypothetical protein